MQASETMPQSADLIRRAIIDVGSNSVRLVVYEGPARTPFVIYNEKVQARLGRSLPETGRIDAEAYARTLRACRRFKTLVDAMGIKQCRTVATAAARDAANGPEFLADLAAIGLAPELLSGEAEASASAAGVISAFPGADGIVGDLGGGSLELIDVRAGNPGRRASFPLGVLLLPARRAGGDKAFRDDVAAMLHKDGWAATGARRPFYLVGGSWRALGHLDMHLTGSALPGVHGYEFDKRRIAPLRAAIAEAGPRLSKTVAAISSSRVAGIDDAALLLGEVGAVLGCERMIVSMFGLREGLLYRELGKKARKQDPLLAAVSDYARRRGNRLWQGDAVAEWIAPVFAGDDPGEERIRRAACHLAAVDLHPQSETRARHGLELAWLGGWIGLTGAERAMLAQALWTAWSGKGRCPQVGETAPEGALRRALGWGEAIRLAERLSGGVSAVLGGSVLTRAGSDLTLAIDPARRDLGGDVVVKQLGALATALGAAGSISPP
jgi:exopolyphosphatase / guanosine-5'-triphosphate,3'-diphosphate pyrophosphatase